MTGIYPIYKPKGPTSNDVVMKIKKIIGIKKVGHGGTLDPLAEGVLVVAVGRRFTKQLRDIVGENKEYLAKVRLGSNSSTDDREGEKEKVEVKHKPEKDEIRRSLKKFIGDIKQKPPIYSAAKISGKEAYKRARKGEKVNPGLHDVTIKRIELLEYSWPNLKLRVITGPGVYIRSLARDIGEELKVGGYLFSLKRTRVGKYSSDKSITIEELKNKVK